MKSVGREAARVALKLMPLALKRNLLFFRAHKKFIPSVPETFSEKIQWRILNDRRQLVARGGDKISMKEHARARVPELLIPETLWFGDDLESMVDHDWQTEWVLKPVTGSGFAAFGSGSMRRSGIDPKAVRKWRHGDIFAVLGEWAYGEARPGFLIERRIETENGKSPHDFRFFVFDGAVRMVQVDSPRVEKVRRRFYSRDWEPYDVTQGRTHLAEIEDPPAELPQLIEIAEAIGSGFDFIRVDLYLAKGRIYFGEITPYPTGGLAPYSDPEFDRLLGSFWELPSTSVARDAS